MMSKTMMLLSASVYGVMAEDHDMPAMSHQAGTTININFNGLFDGFDPTGGLDFDLGDIFNGENPLGPGPYREVDAFAQPYMLDGMTYNGFVYKPVDMMDGATYPGVIVHPWFLGVGENTIAHEHKVAQYFASRGFAAMIMDPFGDGNAFDDIDDPNNFGAAAGNLNNEQGTGYLDPGSIENLRAIALGAYDVLSNAPFTTSSISAVGYCMGGTIAYELARAGAPLDVLVAYHANIPPLAEELGWSVQSAAAFYGRDDPLVPLESRTAAGDYMANKTETAFAETVYHKTAHAFTHPILPGLSAAFGAAVGYNAAASTSSFQATINMFAELGLGDFGVPDTPCRFDVDCPLPADYVPSPAPMEMESTASPEPAM